MKTAFSLLALIATVGFAQAGNFGGPPPFTDGSPLTTGVDGSYSANLTAKNTIGIVRFVYSGNVQTTSTADNSYDVFTEGLTFGGDDQVSITPGSVMGVLDRATNVGFDLSSAMTGDFSASMDMNSSYGTFTGKGTLQVYYSPTGDGLTFVTLFSKNVHVKGARTATATTTD